MKGLVRGLLLLSALVVGYRSYNWLHPAFLIAASVRTHAIEYDLLFSQDAQSAITDYVSKHTLFKQRPCKQQLDALHEQFPVTRDVSLRMQADGVVRAHITAAKPLCILNNSLALTHDNALVPLVVFSPESLAKLPQLITEQEYKEGESCDPICKTCIERMPWQILDEYACTWHNPHTIVFRHKKNSWFSIVCAQDTLPDQTTISLWTQIQRDVDAQQIQQKKSARKQWVADTRFRGQIVLHAHKGVG